MPEGKKRPRSLRFLGVASLLIPVRTTSHYKLIARTYDRMVITVMVLSRQAESLMLWVGPDHHTSRYKSILIIMKSSSFYEPIYTIYTHVFSGVSFMGCMNELRHDSPWLSYT